MGVDCLADPAINGGDIRRIGICRSAGLFFYLAPVELFAAATADQIAGVWAAATPWFEDSPAFRAPEFRSRWRGIFFIVHRLFPFR